MPNGNKQETKNIGSIFKNVSKQGREYLKVTINAADLHLLQADEKGFITLIAFPNDYKEQDFHPDYKMRPSEGRQSATSRKPSPVKQTQKPAPARRPAPVAQSDEETPF
jgi:hypothetical protein